jgi:uncharacterized protein YbjT (DUF2867 family)
VRIVVIGGTGLIGSKLVRHLRACAVDVVAASPASGVNTVTRIGLPEALRGAQVVVDVADSPGFDDETAREYFQTSSRNLSITAANSGVGHLVVLSVVGAERLAGSGYMRAKLDQEAILQAGGVPHTILRSTHTFELLRTIADAATNGDIARVSPALVQPVAAEDVATALARVAMSAPHDRTCELAGPDTMRLADLARLVLRAQTDPRHVIVDPDAQFFGTTLNDETLLPGRDAWIGQIRFIEWLSRTIQVGSSRAVTTH